MKKELKTASIINIIANTVLFISKMIVGLIFGAVSILGDAINSFSDIITSIIIYFTIKINNKEADKMHPFGHTRAENIAGYTTGVLMILLGLSVAKLSITNLMNKTIIEYNILMLAVIALTLIIKLSMFFYIKHTLKTNNSPSLKANMQDHLNDVIIISGVFVAVIGLKLGVWWLDSLIGLIIALYILKEGGEIALENVQYLMGKTAEEKLITKIKKKSMDVKGVLGLNDIKTQYLGNKVQVEIHIEVDEKLTVKKSHDIGKGVQRAIESLDVVNNCFVHIDVYEE